MYVQQISYLYILFYMRSREITGLKQQSRHQSKSIIQTFFEIITEIEIITHSTVDHSARNRATQKQKA